MNKHSPGPSSNTHCMCCGNKVPYMDSLYEMNEKLREELDITKKRLDRAMDQLSEFSVTDDLRSANYPDEGPIL